MVPSHNEISTVGQSTIGRINELMSALGLEVAHFGTSAPMELATLINERPAVVASLSLLNASRFPLPALSGMADRMVVFTGDAGLCGEACQAARASIAGARFVEFEA